MLKALSTLALMLFTSASLDGLCRAMLHKAYRVCKGVLSLAVAARLCCLTPATPAPQKLTCRAHGAICVVVNYARCVLRGSLTDLQRILAQRPVTVSVGLMLLAQLVVTVKFPA